MHTANRSDASCIRSWFSTLSCQISQDNAREVGFDLDTEAKALPQNEVPDLGFSRIVQPVLGYWNHHQHVHQEDKQQEQDKEDEEELGPKFSWDSLSLLTMSTFDNICMKTPPHLWILGKTWIGSKAWFDLDTELMLTTCCTSSNIVGEVDLSKGGTLDEKLWNGDEDCVCEQSADIKCERQDSLNLFRRCITQFPFFHFLQQPW